MRPGTSRNDELDRFKTDINLTEYAAHLGYEVDRSTSSRHSITLRRASDNDKVIVARNTNQHWMFFSVRNGSDNGSIIDFHQHRTGGNLGHTRKALRDFMGMDLSGRPSVKDYVSAVESTPPRDQQALDAEYARTEGVVRLAYLNTDRAIGKEVLSSDRFAGKVRTDHRRHALFPHFDEQGRYSGGEIKGRGFTGFSPGGEKGLWFSNETPEDAYLVVCESAIDCLSHFTLFANKSTDVNNFTRYVSTGGGWSPNTPALLTQSVKGHPGKYVILACDNDRQGTQYIEDATALLVETINERGKVLRVRVPTQHKDWNDQIIKR